MGHGDWKIEGIMDGPEFRDTDWIWQMMGNFVSIIISTLMQRHQGEECQGLTWTICNS